MDSSYINGIFERQCSVYLSIWCVFKMIFHLVHFKSTIYFKHIFSSMHGGSLDMLYQAFI